MRHLIGSALLSIGILFGAGHCLAMESSTKSLSLNVDDRVENALASVDMAISEKDKPLIASLYKREQTLTGILELLLEAAELEQWDDPLFSSRHAYDALLLGYLNKTLDKSRFIDLYDYVQLVHQKNNYRQGGADVKLERVKLNRFTQSELSQWRKTMKDKFDDDLEFSLKDAFESIPENQRYFNFLTLPDGSYVSSDEPQEHRERLGGYFRTVAAVSPLSFVVDDVKHQMIFPPYAFVEAFRKQVSILSPGEIATAIPSLGYHDQHAIRAMRGRLEHPVQLFHPDLDNLTEPHQLYAGTLAGRHDFYHLMVLAFIPPRHQQSFYFLYDIDQ